METQKNQREPAALFESFDDSVSNWNHCFLNPVSTFEARTVAEVITAIQLIETETANGRWAVLLLSYEAGPAFDPAITAYQLTDFPLAWVAIFDSPVDTRTKFQPEDYTASNWEILISKAEYAAVIQRIREHIERGDTYQVNYTIPLRTRFAGDALSWFKMLGSVQGAGFSAYLNLGDCKVLSLSPELFFERRGELLITRPMKGTTQRGRWLEEDEELKSLLATSIKDRAENLMIVDLLRNDLGKISVPGSVRVSNLFAVERYKTLHQMTSTITSTCWQGVGLLDVLTALFPCGSITGAPKIRTMEIIKELEPHPRRAYTGAIGFVKPGGDCLFNVAIRTLVFDTRTQEAIAHVGGGITYDSTAEGEFDECLTKAKFLSEQPVDFGLLETMRVEGGTIFLADRHLQRMRDSARFFGFPFDEGAAEKVFNEIRQKAETGLWKARLVLNKDGVFTVQMEDVGHEYLSLWRVKFASRPVNRDDVFLYHKTTHRAVYEDARSEAGGCDDVLLWNEAGEVTESTIANLVWTEEGISYTPPQPCGLLRGTLRDELVAAGKIKERVITKEELRQLKSFLLINSVRKWMPAILVE